MKNTAKWSIQSLLAAMGALGTVLCFTSAFSVSISVPVVTLLSIGSALLFTFCFMHKKALWVLIPAVVIFIAALVLTELFSPMSPTFIQLVHDVLSRFSSAYPNFSFAIPAAPDPDLPQNTTMFFSVVAVLLTLWLAWGVGYRSCLIVVAGTLPLLLLCVIINDTPPHAFPLVMLLSVWVTVLLSRERPGEPASMDALRTVLILFSVVVLLGVIGFVYPKDDTTNEKLPETLQTILDHLPGPVQNALDPNSKGSISDELGADTGKILDLTQQGTRERKDTVMMQLSTTQSGPLYLRGAAKDIYTGTSWESSDEATQAESVYAQTSLGTAFGSDNQAAVQIKNYRDNATVLFAPYGYISCTSADDILSDLRIEIGENDYVIYYWPGVRTLDITQQTGHVNADYDQYVQDHCLQLPDGVKDELYNLAVSYGYDPNMSTAQTIAWVAEFIRSVGTYKLNVSRQPTNFDFALYFLEQSKEGYCVHFATAAAVMYRALGIPARYASGYRVTVADDSMVTDVTDQDTHAWAEVYLSGLGWIPVETTPGFGETSMLPEVENDVETPPSASPSPSPSAEPADSSEAGSTPTPAATPTPSAAADDTGSSQELGTQTSDAPAVSSQGVGTRHLLYLLLILPVLIAAAFLVLLIRRMILRRIRKKSFYVANTNQAVLNLWQYAQRLALWGADPSEEEEALALKAKFSQHTITPEELEPYRASILQMAELTRLTLTPWRRFRFTWFAALDYRSKKK